MKVLADPGVVPAAERTPSAAAPPPAPRTPAPPSGPPPSQTASGTQTNDPPAASPETPVTFTLHQDASGRFYYIVTDTQTGQVIGQLPPEEVRSVSEGIAAYIKQQEARNASNQHIETKA